ncbi:MAG: dihydroorotase [Flavobacteriales bacterium]|jgi:dihydroorotase|nr:dihydroorotase [Flavobacteriales bacterium]
MSNKILIKNARIINEGTSLIKDILIEGLIISKIDTEINVLSSVNIINAEGLTLIPGMIDDQVHFREPGLTHKGDIFSESRAAVAGGVTSFIEMPNTIPNTTNNSALNEKIEIAKSKSFANFSFMFGGTNYNLDDILSVDDNNIAGIKLFLGSSTGNMLIDNHKVIEEIFRNTKLPISVHCEDEYIIKKNLINYINKYGDDIPIDLHPEIRNEEACYKSSKFAIELAKKTDARLNVFHISTAKELDLFDNKLPLRQKKITSEACAHHLWFTDKDYKLLGTKIKWNPAIKTERDKNELWNAVLNDKIDIIASDHSPHTIEEKNRFYTKCPSGGPMVQHSIISILTESKKYNIGIEKIVEKISHNPAIVFNIKKRGFIKEGYYADIVLIDTKKDYNVTKDSLLYKCNWSPFEGQTFDSSIFMTFVNGQIVYDKGKIVSDPKGKQLIFDR